MYFARERARERERARWPAHSHFLLPHFLLFSSFLLLPRSSVCLSVSRLRPGERLYGSSSSNSSSNVCSVFCVCVCPNEISIIV